ncbi:MAG TPA: alpha/beta fold hydrolase [Streptosporangiaceae bacterium]|nr:alpha/beta fold hydrolase [Streptosporangiaceae bacterium]
MWATEPHEGITGVTFDSDGHRLVGTLYLARDVTAAVDYLAGCPQVDADRIAVVGHSLGGWAALVTAATEPRLRAVGVYGAAARLGAGRGFGLDQLEQEFTRFLATTPEDFAVQLALVAEQMDGLAAVTAIRPRPLLVVHGTWDRWVPVAQARELAARAGSPSRYVEVEGANHAFSWHRAELANVIADWLGAAWNHEGATG